MPKKNNLQSIFQKVRKKYPSVGWSHIFFWCLLQWLTIG